MSTMEPLQITYEITEDDYVEGMVLLSRRRKPRGSVRWGMPLVGLTVLLLPLVSREPDGSYNAFLAGLSVFGAFLFYCGVIQHLTRWNSRRFYKRSGVVGERYTALFSPDHVLVEGKNVQWRIKWAGFSVREESEKVFMLYSAPIVYIFAKRYFTEDQISSLKTVLTALPPTAVGS